MGSWPIPGAGAKGIHRQPTVSAFPSLPLPWTSDSKVLLKKYVPFPPSPHRTRGEELNFKKLMKYCGWIFSIIHWKYSQWARLCGLDLIYGARRAVQGCWRLIAQFIRVIKFIHCIFHPPLAKSSLGGVCQSYQSVPASRPVVFIAMWPWSHILCHH